MKIKGRKVVAEYKVTAPNPRGRLGYNGAIFIEGFKHYYADYWFNNCLVTINGMIFETQGGSMVTHAVNLRPLCVTDYVPEMKIGDIVNVLEGTIFNKETSWLKLKAY